MSDPSRDLAPRGHALHLEDLGHIVDDHDEAGGRALEVEPRHGPVQRPQLIAHNNRELLAHGLEDARAEPALQAAKRVEGLSLDQLPDLVSHRVVVGDSEQPNCRWVDGQDHTVRVEREHSRGNAAKDDLHLGATALEVLAAEGEIRGHPVEGAHELREFVAAAGVEADVEVPCRDLRGRSGKSLDRIGHLLGESKPEPRREQEREQRDHREQEQHARLEGALARLHPPVGVDGRLDRGDVRADRARNEAVDDHDAHDVRAIERGVHGHDRANQLALPRLLDQRARDTFEPCRDEARVRRLERDNCHLGVNRRRELLVLSAAHLNDAQVVVARLRGGESAQLLE